MLLLFWATQGAYVPPLTTIPGFDEAVLAYVKASPTISALVNPSNIGYDLLPYSSASGIVLSSGDGDTEESSICADGRIPYTHTFTMMVESYNGNRAIARSIGVAMIGVLTDATLLFLDGTLLHLRRAGDTQTTLEPRDSPSGQPVYKNVVKFIVSIQRYI